MNQRKRPGGDDGLGYYCSWNKSSSNGCIYCGGKATTREHLPSKAFLVEPYPEDMATMPACFDCNNGFSKDEEYVSCYLEVLKAAIYPGYSISESVQKRLARNEKLAHAINEQIQKDEGKICFRFDQERFCRILTKLAQGHAGYEFDYVNFDSNNTRAEWQFVFHMTQEALEEFDSIPQMPIFPEIGSRSCATPYIVQNIETGEAAVFMFWNVIQEGRYRYQVTYNAEMNIQVKIVIYEFLYCVVELED